MKKILNHPTIKVAFLLVMASLLCFSFYDYSSTNEKRMEENYQSITEKSNQQSNAVVQEKLKDKLHILEAYALLLSQSGDITSDASFQKLQPLIQNEAFTQTAITNANGITYIKDHEPMDSFNQSAYLEGMKGNTQISNSMYTPLDHQEVIVMSVPIYKEDIIIGVLHAALPANLKDALELSFLFGNVSSFLIQSDGKNLTPTEDYDSDFFSTLKNEQMHQDLQQKKQGYFTLEQEGKTQYACYSPINGTNWFLVSILPYSTAETIGHNLDQTLLLAGKIGIILLFIYFYFFYLQYQGARDVKTINQHLDAVIANTPGTSYQHVIHKPETIIFFKQRHNLLAGYTKEEIYQLVKTDIFSLINHEDYEALQKSLDHLAPNTVVSNTYRITNKNQRIQWILDQRQRVSQENEDVYYVETLDITEIKQTQERLKISEERYQLILRETRSVIFEWNLEIDQITFSDLWKTSYGYPTVLNDFLVLTNQRFLDTQHSYIPLIEALISGQKNSDQIECILPKADGELVWVKIFAKAIHDDQGYLLRIVGSISDIHQEKQRTMQLMERAQRDGLTKVYNRITIESLINQEIERHPHQNHVIFVIDIDDFKSINDTLGHTAGDEALAEFSAALTSCFRSDDIIGRIGGDEFVVFMKHLDHLDHLQIEAKCQRLLDALSQIHLRADSDYHLHCSIGIALHPVDGDTYQSMFECADRRLYLAKKQGKSTYIYQD